MKLFNLDSVFISISIIILSTASYLLFKDIFPEGRLGTDPVGIITFKKKVAQRKFTEDVIWEPLQQRAQVYNYDYIRTDSDSSAVVTFDDGTELNLDENSMVLIRKDKNQISISFDSGSINAKIGGKSQIKISTGTTSVSIKEGNLSLSGNKNSAELNVSEGSAEVSNASGAQTITPDESAVIAANTVEKKPQAIKLENPDNGKFFIAAGETKTVQFNWKGPEDAQLQISYDRSFSKLILGKNFEDARAEYQFPQGHYYWRIATGKETSSVRTFSVLKEQAIIPLTPADSEVIKFTKSNPVVSFRWEGSQNASSYELLISKERTFADTVKTFTTASTFVSTDELPAGTYYWKIRTNYLYDTDMSLRTTETRSFTLSHIEKIEPPQLTTPLEGSTISLTLVTDGKSSFSWNGIPGIKSYILQISKDKSFRTVDQTLTTELNNSVMPAQLVAGKYYWRVAAQDENQDKTDPSEVRSFTLSSVIDIANLQPSDGATPDSGDLRLAWKDPNRGSNYLIEISNSADFKKILKSEHSSEQMLNIKITTPGKYFWRASLLNEKEKKLTVSNPTSFSIPKQLEAPALLTPSENQNFNLDSTEKIVLKWKPVKDASHYILSLKYIIAGEEFEMARIETSKNEYTISDFTKIKLGTLKAELSAVEKTKGKVIAKSQPFKRSFSISYVSDLPAPEVTSPQVLYVK